MARTMKAFVMHVIGESRLCPRRRRHASWACDGIHGTQSQLCAFEVPAAGSFSMSTAGSPASPDAAWGAEGGGFAPRRRD
jgi:hypothetical protein